MEVIVALVVFVIVMAYVYHLQCSIDNLQTRIEDIEGEKLDRVIAKGDKQLKATRMFKASQAYSAGDRMTRTVKDEVIDDQVTRRMTMLRKEED